MDSNLSSVPPVWPRPRPEIMGLNAPQAATAGASIKETLSPTPPVECLSTTASPNSDQSRTSPEIAHCKGQRHCLVPVHAVEKDSHSKGSDLPFTHTAIRNPFDELANFIGGQPIAVAFFEYDFLGKQFSILYRFERAHRLQGLPADLPGRRMRQNEGIEAYSIFHPMWMLQDRDIQPHLPRFVCRLQV